MSLSTRWWDRWEAMTGIPVPEVPRVNTHHTSSRVGDTKPRTQMLHKRKQGYRSWPTSKPR